MERDNPIGTAARTALLDKYGSVRAAALALDIPYTTLDRNLRNGDKFTANQLRLIIANTDLSWSDLGQEVRHG